MKNGVVTLTDKEGTGVELDEACMAKYEDNQFERRINEIMHRRPAGKVVVFNVVDIL